jgi:4-amino-4-deoxy-L-arabinose transferase-like glycosyltransferase
MVAGNKKEIIIILGMMAAYLLTRLFNLTILPIFTDEAIYLHWSKIMANDAALRFLPLVDGKPPLFMWLVMAALKVFKGGDILWVGRLVAVIGGMLGILGTWFAARQLFADKKIAVLACLFYLLVPFTFFYDRLALADSWLTAFGIWSLGLGVLLVKTGRLDAALILGAVIGLGRLTKSPAIFFLLLLPFLVLIRKVSLSKLIFYFILIFGISETMFSFLRLFPLFNMIAQKNAEFTLTLAEFLKHPFALTMGNLKSLWWWQFQYLTPLAALSAAAGFFAGLKKNWRVTLILACGFLFPVLAMASFNKIIYPRYLLPFTPVLLILAAYALSFKVKLSFLVFIFPALVIFKLLTDPVNAPIPQADRDQYLDGWAAGNGVVQIRDYLAGKSGVLATEGTFGLMPYALDIYQEKYPQLEIRSYWPLPEKLPADTDYLIVYQRPDYPAGYKLEELFRFRQGYSNDYLRLYKVIKQ